MSELLPRPIRLLIGATSRSVADAKVRDAVRGKIVLITGASSGVGEATATKLGAAGATVLLVARREEELARVRDRILADGGSAFVHRCDIADVEQVGELVETVLEQHDHVDILVSNAGLSIRRWVSQEYTRFHDIQRTINVNYLGPVRLVLGLLPGMRQRGSGHIVSVASVGVDLPPLRWSAYIASKAAFETWLGGVAPEIRADGVGATSIHLQLVRSPMLGPFKIWNYLPGMSTEEAAGIVARAIVDRPRTISPLWARGTAAAYRIAQEPFDFALAAYARRRNPESRRYAPEPPLPLAALAGAGTIAASGVVRPIRPDRLLRAGLALQRYGATPASALAAGAALYPSRVALVDEIGELTFSELDRDARALAAAFHDVLGLRAGQRVALMCRNHRGFVQAAAASTRLGCDLVPLNSDFAAPALADVLAREGVDAVVHDEEFEALFDRAAFAGSRVIAWHEHEAEHPTLRSLMASATTPAPAPPAPGRIVMLTSGTTGTPKGAVRTVRIAALAPLAVAGLLDLARIKPTPRSGEPVVVAPPLFHLYGMIGFMGAFAFGSPVVIGRRFDPAGTLAQIERHGAAVLLAVPTMLSRIMDLPEEVRADYDTGSLRMIISGAAPLAPELARAVMDHFGEVLYNGYASTEVGSGTLATPADLRAAPGTVGRPAAGVTIKILDADGHEVPTGQTGRVFVGSPLLFEGYTGGGGKQVIDGLMSTGDLGHCDARGRLFIDGRDHDIILSGGENVFPQEVEELLSAHDSVLDAAVFGVPDADFGQRLAALVVRKPGASVSVEELKSHIKRHLARHKVPREIAFVPELPRTSTGKLQRRKLPASLEAG